MHTTMPSQAYLKELFNYDPETGYLFNKKPRAGVTVGSRAGSVDSWGHRQIKIDGKTYQEHRIVWLWWYGALPPCQLHHINKMRADNRVENLKEAPRDNYDNQQDTLLRKDNISGVKGVCWLARYNKWQVQIQTDNKKKHIGLYTCLLDAVSARFAAERRYFTYLHQ